MSSTKRNIHTSPISSSSSSSDVTSSDGPCCRVVKHRVKKKQKNNKKPPHFLVLSCLPFALGWWGQQVAAGRAFPHLDVEAGCKADRGHKWAVSAAEEAVGDNDGIKTVKKKGEKNRTNLFKILLSFLRYSAEPAWHQAYLPMCCLFSHPLNAPTLPPDWDHQSQQTISGALRDRIPATETTEI